LQNVAPAQTAHAPAIRKQASPLSKQKYDRQPIPVSAKTASGVLLQRRMIPTGSTPAMMPALETTRPNLAILAACINRNTAATVIGRGAKQKA
jgi:hypothetical protein